VTVDYRNLPGQALADRPSAWDVQLKGEDVLVIYASSYGPEGDGLAYDLLLAGRPPVLMTVVSGPPELLDDVFTEEPEDLPANDFDWSSALDVQFVAVPDRWFLSLANGHQLLVHANDVQERDGEHVFTLNVRGDGPPLPVARISSRLVTDVRREPAVDDLARPT
jgi:hypothetical protein